MDICNQFSPLLFCGHHTRTSVSFVNPTVMRGDGRNSIHIVYLPEQNATIGVVVCLCVGGGAEGALQKHVLLIFPGKIG